MKNKEVERLIDRVPLQAIRCLELYRQPHRFYHTEGHIEEMLEGLLKYKLSSIEIEILTLAIIYHDCVYDPKRSDNEKLSCDKFDEDNFSDFFEHQYNLERVKKVIMATKNHVYGKGNLEDIIINLDMKVFSRSIMGLIEYEHGIFNEYQFVPITTYITERVYFLKTILEKFNNSCIVNNINFLIDYVQNREYKIGIFAGSWRPYHRGHDNIRAKAEEIFDKVIIARGINPDKTGIPEFELPSTLYNEVIEYDGLVTELFSTLLPNVKLFFVRGLRNVYDLGYEENIRKTVHDINPDIKFAYFFCDREYEHISSSSIRGLLKFDKNAAKKYML